MKIKENQKTFKIGFLNYKDNSKYEEFKKYFDIVYNKDENFVNIKRYLGKFQ